MRLRCLTIAIALAGLSDAPADEDLIKNGSFEALVVTARATVVAGGQPANADDQTAWASFVGKDDDDGVKIVVGITNEREKPMESFTGMTQP